MSCCTCSKDVLKNVKEKLNLLEETSLENIVKAWVLLYSKSFDTTDITKNLMIPDEFIQEVQLFLTLFDLIDYLKKRGETNKNAINVICAMAYCGLLEAKENDDIWRLKQKDGSTVAHWAAKGGVLRVPYESTLWRIGNHVGNTPAHYAAENGYLNVPYHSDLWRIKNNIGNTPAHLAATNGHLSATYESDLWRIGNENDCTPAHKAALRGFLEVPYDSDLWRLKDVFDVTPAHQAAMKGYLKAPYDSDLWYIENGYGNTPAHYAARNGHLHVPHNSHLWRIKNEWWVTPAHNAALNGYLSANYDSDLWRIPDEEGQTPAHLASQAGILKAPYKSDLWLIRDKEQRTPADLSNKVFTVLLHHSNDTIKQYFNSKNINISATQNVWDILGAVKVLVLLDKFSDNFQNINYRGVTNKIKPSDPELCDFELIFKNITQRWFIEQISNYKQVNDLYYHALAGALSYFFNEKKHDARHILLNKHYAYVEDSTYSLLLEFGVWAMIEKIAYEKYGVSLRDLII